MQHIAVAGNIGAGKTTLATKLAKHYGWEVSFESVDDNPYLSDFYEDMPRWAFHLQMYFLNHRFNQALQVKHNQKASIQDRSIYEDAHIFAKNLHQSGLMSERDYQSYIGIFNSMLRFVSPPDLLIYMRADLDKLKKQIKMRGRGFENAIPDEYLLNLNEHYEEWISSYQAGNLIILETGNKDFLNNAEDWQELLTQIEDKIHAITAK